MFSFLFSSVHSSRLLRSKCVGCVGLSEPIKCSEQRVKSPTCPPVGLWRPRLTSLKEPPKRFTVGDRRPLQETQCEGHSLLWGWLAFLDNWIQCVFLKCSPAYDYQHRVWEEANTQQGKTHIHTHTGLGWGALKMTLTQPSTRWFHQRASQGDYIHGPPTPK